jgi:histone H3/H4
MTKEALEEVRDIVEEHATEMAEQAVRLSRHSNRKTVMKHDIEFVSHWKK